MGEHEGPRRLGLRRAVRYAGIAIAGAAALAAAAGAGLWCELRPVAPGEGQAAARAVVIPPGASTRQIGDLLAGQGLVRSSRAVMVAAWIQGVSGRLRHGEYALSPAQGALEVVRVIARGESIQHRVTIPEGYTVVQIAQALSDAGLVDRERFVELALHGGKGISHPALSGLPSDSLEGYLFPDTYQFTRGLGEAAVLSRFLDRLEERVEPKVRAAASARGLSLHQLLTVASMIEREARVPDERRVISGVIHNRLRLGMRLEIDATVLYALGEHRPMVTARDLEVDSPYNTYRHKGLPPGPIANPGLASIAAAVDPADVPYLYYVLKPDGSHHFSRTLDEHLRAVRHYRP